MNLNHLHPMLVHFPIALALVAFLFDVAFYFFKKEWLNKGSLTLTVLAALGAIAAISSGFLFTKPVAGLAATIKEVHVMYAVISTALLVIASVVGLIRACKKTEGNRWQYVYTLLLFLTAICISLTGMKGGSIVYDVWLF